MIVSTRHRITLLACAAILAAPALFAATPSGRTAVRMVYDSKTMHTILFGGTTKVDAGTRQSYDLADTWEWTGTYWVQRYPAHSPHGRSFHTMAYETSRSRVLLFGGKFGTSIATGTELNDTWAFDGNDWTQINTPNSPTPRIYSSMEFDPIRDRMVLFGGTNISNDGKTTTNLSDTWEFDGTTWTQKATTGPAVVKPELVYDAIRNRMVMVGTNDKTETVMYAYDAPASTWTAVTATALPTCANDARMVYQKHNDTIMLFGGVCQTSDLSGDTWEYDGTTWNKIAAALDPDRLGAEAIAYDEFRRQTLVFGGTLAFGNPTGTTHIYKDQKWSDPKVVISPPPRSLFVFVPNPDEKLIWLYGGLNDANLGNDFWKYQDGEWSRLPLDNGPALCGTATGTYDTDRKKLVVVCSDSSTFEWDGNAWKGFTGLKTPPPFRNFSSLAYDATIKKTVLFGGFDDIQYLDQTWTWDGAQWTRVKKNPAPQRALASMWYDPTLKKTVLFGGLGRRSTEDRLERFNDMWTFDGNGWTELKNVPSLPGSRYGAQVAVDPRTGQVLLFGGLRLDVNGAIQSQVYADDLWSWNGSTWTKLSANGNPPPRENGAFAYDPSTNALVLFAGYAGHYLSDIWALDPQNNWTLRAEPATVPPVIPPRRRAIK